MEETDMQNGKHLPISAIGSRASYVQRWNARMTPDEAMQGIHRMLTAYPEGKAGCSDGYLVTLTETLCQFPREVAVAACSPVHGVPKVVKNFRPTAGQIQEWCSNEREKLWRVVKFALPGGDSHKTYTGTFSFNNHLVVPQKPESVNEETQQKIPIDELLKRIAKGMGRRGVKDGHLTIDDATRVEQERVSGLRAVRIDRANERGQAAWDRYASRSEGIKISPALQERLKGDPNFRIEQSDTDLEPVPF